MPNYLKEFECLGCHKKFDRDYPGYICDECSENLDAVYDYDAISSVFSIDRLKNDQRKDVWRYKPFFPFDSLDNIPSLELGLTPLYRAGFIENETGLKEVYIKDDTRLPSSSFKDRASSVVMAVAKEKGIDVVAAASTGNAGCSWACMGASSGIKVIIYVPKTAPRAKLAQIKVYGAEVRIVDGTYDDAYDLCVADSKENNYFNRCTGYNPYTREGKKSVSFEIWEQLGYKIPGTVFVPVGDGNIISGVWKGFKDLKKAGLTDSLPQLVAVQSTLSAAVSKTVAKVRALDRIPDKISLETVKASTRADSISVDLPRDGLAAVRAVLETEGLCVEVDDSKILSAISFIAENTGVFAEPAGSTSVAGILELSGKTEAWLIKEPAVCLITGNGLKDVDAVI